MEIQVIQNKIYEIRGVRVMLDFDLAMLYQTETKRVNEAAKRNIKRFPDDFMFQLTLDEFVNLKSQIATSSWGGSRKLPYAFTEQGVAMLSGLLGSDAAIYANIVIMRAFVAMRNYIATASTVTAELAAMRVLIERLKRDSEDTTESVNDLSEYTRKEIYGIWDAITALSERPQIEDKPRRPIGYRTAAMIDNEE
jgi:hypothetical protein